MMTGMESDAWQLLAALGVTISEGDPLLGYLLGSVKERICNLTAQDEIPDGLAHVAVEMIAGLYLQMSKDSGTLSAAGISLDAPAKSITEGDTTVSYAVGEGTSTPEQRLNEMVDAMIHSREREIYRYRKLVW